MKLDFKNISKSRKIRTKLIACSIDYQSLSRYGLHLRAVYPREDHPGNPWIVEDLVEPRGALITFPRGLCYADVRKVVIASFGSVLDELAISQGPL